MEKSLHEKLGGAEKIKTIVDDIVDAHLGNAVIRARFLPYLERPEYVDKVKQHMCDLLGTGSGGPEHYTGRDMMKRIHGSSDIQEPLCGSSAGP